MSFHRMPLNISATAGMVECSRRQSLTSSLISPGFSALVLNISQMEHKEQELQCPNTRILNPKP